MKQITRLKNEYLKLFNKKIPEGIIRIESQFDIIRKELEKRNIVPLLDRGKIIFYNITTKREE